MKRRSILFNTEMVRAVIAGRKTKTRRLVKPQPKSHHWEYFKSYKLEVKKLKFGDYRFKHSINERNGEVKVEEWDGSPISSQYQVGDILYVRETFSMSEHFRGEKGDVSKIWYKADNNRPTWAERKWRPSIHMPKWAARIFLKVTDVRVERLKDMTAQDFIAEGCGQYDDMAGTMKSPAGRYINHKKGFIETWNLIYKDQCLGWDKNPYVFVYEFERTDG